MDIHVKLLQIMSVILFLPLLAVGTRRLHDVGESGWWQLFCLVPVVGIFIVAFFGVKPGQAGQEQAPLVVDG